MSTDPRVPLLIRCTLLGVATGLRSQTGIAAPLAARRPGTLPSGLARVDAALAHPAAVRASQVAAVGELVADKLPVAGSRTDPAALAARLVFGAIGGGLLAASGAAGRRRRATAGITAAGAAAGALGAAAGTFGGHRARLRSTATATANLDGRAATAAATGVALAEDALAISLASAAVNPRRARG